VNTLGQPISLTDPLVGFDWSSLGSRYKELCRGFDPSTPYLDAISPRPESDRALYSVLVARFAEELESDSGITFETYLAMLYWKLYSQGAAVANTCKFLIENAQEQENASIKLRQLSSHMREASTKEPHEVIELLRAHDKFCFRGMKTDTALPVRSTFIHFVKPGEVPIFDKQVLFAVGISEKNANQKFRFLEAYLPHARKLAAEHAQFFTSLNREEYREEPLRLIDMALWVVLGRPNRRKRKCAC
jgi:hypothetical protein